MLHVSTSSAGGIIYKFLANPDNSLQHSSTMRLRKLWSLGLLYLLVNGGVLFSQPTTGTVQGVIVDQQQAQIPGVTITGGLDTNATRTTISCWSTTHTTVWRWCQRYGPMI